MSGVPYLDLRAQYDSISEEILDALRRVCESTAFAQGPECALFEQEFAAYCGVRHCVTVNSGTSALHLALRCLEVGEGDEVITASMTFIATVWAISYVGATPVFVDIDPQRRTIDPAKLEQAITAKTKAIIPVYLYGAIADMDAIRSVAEKHGIPVVEDAAQAHGARYNGKMAGQLGQVACFSFYPGKNLGAYGEGGALVTNDEQIASRAASLRNHAQTERYLHCEIGYNYRMDSVQAAVLRVKLQYLDEWNAARRRHAARYNELLQHSRYETPVSFPGSEPVWHCYVIECDGRDSVRQRLARNGIGTGLQYPLPVHLQKAYAALGYSEGILPVTEQLAQRCLSLPMFPELSNSQISTVVECLFDE